MSAILEDASGYWEIKDQPISKVGVFPYLGANLLGAEDPLKVYMILRPAEELGSPETIDSFKLQPWIITHDMLGPKEKGLTPPEEKGVHGVTGEDVYFREDTGILYGNLKCFSEKLKEKSKNLKGLSLGYFHDVDWTPGVWNGIPYDGVQRNIKGNHMASVPSGRMGPDVALDSLQSYDPNPIFEETNMDLDELIAAVKAMAERLDRLEGASASGDNADGAAKDNADSAGADNADEADKEKEGSAGQDDAGSEGGPTPEMLADALKQLGERLDRLEGGSASGDNADGAAKDNAAADNADSAANEDKEKGASMDAALVHKNLLADLHVREKLVKRLTPILGSFDHDLMTSMEVAAYACKKLGVPFDKGQAGTAIAAYLHGAAKNGNGPAFSMDSAITHGNSAKSAKMNAYLEGK